MKTWEAYLAIRSGLSGNSGFSGFYKYVIAKYAYQIVVMN